MGSGSCFSQVGRQFSSAHPAHRPRLDLRRGNWSLDTTLQMDGSIAMHGPANSLSTDPKHLLANDVFLHVYSEREYRDFDAEYLFS